MGGSYRRFGSKYELSVDTAAEGLKCLLSQISEFKAQIKLDTVRLRISGKDITADELNAGMHSQLFDGDKVVILPSIHGAKSGLGMFIAGVVIAIAAFYTGGAALAAMGAWSTGFALAGAALAFSGLSMMMTKTPNAGLSSATDNGKANQYFSSLDNRTGQGAPVPILYGELVVGSNVISQGLETR